jgi:hypothetical protein
MRSIADVQWLHRRFHTGVIVAPVIRRIVDIQFNFIAIRVPEINTLADCVIGQAIYRVAELIQPVLDRRQLRN